MESEEPKPIKKVYDYNTYNKNYYDKNRDNKIECPDCKKVYSVFNKAHHKKSAYHRKITEYLEKNKNEI
jgi:hypothetical protein